MWKYNSVQWWPKMWILWVAIIKIHHRWTCIQWLWLSLYFFKSNDQTVHKVNRTPPLLKQGFFLVHSWLLQLAGAHWSNLLYIEMWGPKESNAYIIFSFDVQFTIKISQKAWTKKTVKCYQMAKYFRFNICAFLFLPITYYIYSQWA